MGIRITIGDNTRHHMGILEISQYPFTEQEIKDNFKRLIKANHPDIKGVSDPETTEKARNIIDAYNAIKNLAVPEVTAADMASAFAEFEQSMEDLFKGKLWEFCPHCEGSGRVKRTIYKWVDCPVCLRGGYVYPICRACKGEGKVLTRWTKNIVTCRVCEGEGIYTKTRPRRCPHCGGLGEVRKQEGEEFISCGNCRGLGKIEIKPFNPVLRAGAVLI